MKKPKYQEVTITYADETVLTFTVDTPGDCWKGGTVRLQGGDPQAIDVNRIFRHGANEQTWFRSLSADVLCPGAPPLPAIDYGTPQYWTTANGRRMYMCGGVPIYALRVLNADELRARVGTDAPIVDAQARVVWQ